MAKTSVPRWGAAPAGKPWSLEKHENAQHVVIIALSPHPVEAAKRVKEVVAGVSSRHRSCAVDTFRSSTECLGSERMGRILTQARVGWHFVLIGTDADVSVVRSHLLENGVLSAEITPLLTENNDPFAPKSRQIYCAHCKHIFAAHTPIGGHVVCGNCEQTLVVYYHFSRLAGGYLGYRDDSEEL